ncbi:serine peptidase [Pseudohongiella acticola]|uniref:Serine peptidase n=1 Tax=Pseudohongiella acticola TaxID=1524254 RepID=A0A1E8CG04_9GAMM|nr:S49 family peptidase [Pseudohongiella acticola]OFE11388.1 serine peptidase [Pseudohongiella acticola]
MPAINYPHIAMMVFNTPLYATPDLVRSVRAALEPRLLGKSASGDMITELMELSRDEERAIKDVEIHGRVAIIPVHGILVARRGQIDAACQELISYERLATVIHAAVKHDLVEEIVLDFHTGGGQAIGCKELADNIRAWSQIKPITAVVNFAAYSAGYYLASACSRIVCSPTGGVGSVGVIIETYEVSKWEEEIGIKYNTFYRGDHKNDFSPHEPITDQAVEQINTRLDYSYNMFVESVASYRGLSAEAVIDTQARCFSAEEALALKLIDEIAPGQQAVNAIAQKYTQSTQPNGRRVQARAKAVDLNCRF